MNVRHHLSQFVVAGSLPLAALLMFCALPGVAKSDEAESKAAAPEAGAAPSAFPYKLNLELGKAEFQTGDQITILEIRGTAETFQTGQLYWIKGKYTLASHDLAGVGAFVTGTDSKNAHASFLDVQMAAVKKGEGTFTVFLPMLYRGLPHVSFYAGGEGFGGVYFGTAGDETPVAKAGSATQSVKFELGKVAFAEGDKITITEVRGSSEQFEKGGTYVIKGTYKLASHDKAKLAAHVSAADPSEGRHVASQPAQQQAIERGEGTFELTLPMTHRGYPHVSLYPAGKGGSGFGEVYFGTGDSVFK